MITRTDPNEQDNVVLLPELDAVREQRRATIRLPNSSALPRYAFDRRGPPDVPRRGFRREWRAIKRELIMSVPSEILDVLGPRIQFLTELSDNDEDYCLIKGTVPPGVVVPIHSHPERETFYVLDGEVEGLWENRWISLIAGDIFDVPGGLKHGWRNASGTPASLLIVVPMRLGRFLRAISRPAETASQSAPKPADFQRLLEIARAYGYWTGSPADNAAVGISLG